MPSKTVSVPKYRHHKGSGQAFVQVNGRRHYVGPLHSTHTNNCGHHLVGSGPSASAFSGPCLIRKCIQRRTSSTTLLDWKNSILRFSQTLHSVSCLAIARACRWSPVSDAVCALCPGRWRRTRSDISRTRSIASSCKSRTCLSTHSSSDNGSLPNSAAVRRSRSIWDPTFPPGRSAGAHGRLVPPTPASHLATRRWPSRQNAILLRFRIRKKPLPHVLRHGHEPGVVDPFAVD